MSESLDDESLDPLPELPEPSAWQAAEEPAHGDDGFIEKDGVRYAGTHLLLELWGARSLNDAQAIEAALVRAAEAAKAHVLHVQLHTFEPSGGVTGVVLLAESHISIHTWPERAYAAIDIFMCRTCDPYDAVPALREAFAPDSIELTEHKRGRVTP